MSAENHANAAATAEHRFGAGRGCAELLYLHLVPGVGAGLILGNRLYRGACGTAGEIGHVTVDPHGASCGCGSRGCLATSASLTALERQVQPLTTSAAFDNWIRLAGLGEHRIRRLITDTGMLAGTAVASTFTLLDPERVVVGGAFAQAEPMCSTLSLPASIVAPHAPRRRGRGSCAARWVPKRQSSAPRACKSHTDCQSRSRRRRSHEVLFGKQFRKGAAWLISYGMPCHIWPDLYGFRESL